MVRLMGMKARPVRAAPTPADVVADWREGTGTEYPVHVYRRAAGGVHVLVFVTGEPVAADTGVGLAVQAIIADEMSSS